MKRLVLFSLLLMWLPAAPLLGQEKSKSPKKISLVKAKSLSLRTKPATNAKVKLSLGKFYPAEVISTKGDWAMVKTLKGTTGFVLNKYLTRGPYLSIEGKAANVRSGPKSQDSVLFTLANHYPVKVLEKSGARVKIVDYEGDSGWVHQALLTDKSYVIVRLKSINLREGPGTEHAKRFTAEKSVVFEVLGERDGWLHVKHSDGDEGWCSAKIVWGWLP